MSVGDQRIFTFGNHFWLQLCICLQMLVVLIGLGVACWQVESIIGTGPILSIVGIIVAVLSYQRSMKGGVLFGLSGLGLCVGVFLTIFLLDWSPGDARIPVPIMGGVYLGIAGSYAIAWLLQLRASSSTQQAASAESSITEMP